MPESAVVSCWRQAWPHDWCFAHHLNISVTLYKWGAYMQALFCVADVLWNLLCRLLFPYTITINTDISKHPGGTLDGCGQRRRSSGPWLVGRPQSKGIALSSKAIYHTAARGIQQLLTCFLGHLTTCRLQIVAKEECLTHGFKIQSVQWHHFRSVLADLVLPTTQWKRR